MSLFQRPIRSCLFLLAMALFIAAYFSACSTGPAQRTGDSSGNPGGMAPGTGGIGFRLVWKQSAARSQALFTPPFNACVDHAVDTIAATVSSGTVTVTDDSWPCSLHEAVILGIPAGTNYTVRVNGISSGPTTTAWAGLASPITVVAGQIADAGTIVMTFIGSDSTSPAVISITPRSIPTSTTNVPVTDRFSIAFDEPMALSTLVTANISLIKTVDASTVPGTIRYLPSSSTAEFIPAANLAANSEYVLQVLSCATLTSCITDVAGNKLASDYTNTFTSEPAAGGIPAAPAGVTATPGNGQVTLDWLASGGTTSYNVYYSLTSGSTGTQIPDVRAPFVHLGRANGTTYYYVVTAVSSSGESPVSTETSAAPAFPAGNPLPPANVAVSAVSTQNSISWSAVAGASSYNLYWSPMTITPDKNAADNVIRGVTSPFTHTGLSDGTLYCYIVTAMNAKGESVDSMQACSGIGAIHISW